jgi:hypothetical protein
MPGWLGGVLDHIRGCAEAGKVRFTIKALRELADLGPGFDEADAVDVLRTLTREDSAGRIRSRQTGEWMYVFKPSMAATVVYVKVIVRGDCVVISFHKDWDEQKENSNDQDR